MSDKLDINLTALLGNDAKAQDAEMCKLITKIMRDRGIYYLEYSAQIKDFDRSFAMTTISNTPPPYDIQATFYHPEETA